jgi:hypothetical protein
MGATEVWYTIEDGNLYKTEENDGARYVRRGAETKKILLCTVEEAVKKHLYELAKATK